MKWLTNFFKESRSSVDININLSYFNSSTLKVLFTIFDIFEKAVKNGSVLNIVWVYDEENEFSQESGEDFIEDFPSLSISLVADDQV